ncbi:hypothetical protein CR513_47693, partial [Mucuna pruriens]
MEIGNCIIQFNQYTISFTFNSYIVGRAIAIKIAQARYYWPTLKKDCTNSIRRCDKCQWFASIHKAPPKQLHSVTSPWPFCMWGVDILGPFRPTSNIHKQIGKQSQQSGAEGLKEEIRKSQRVIGRGTIPSAFVASHHTAPNHAGNPILINVRHRCDNPGGDWKALPMSRLLPTSLK